MSAAQCKRLGWGDELVNCTLDFITRLRGIEIDLTEFCILNAVVLTYPGEYVVSVTVFGFHSVLHWYTCAENTIHELID